MTADAQTRLVQTIWALETPSALALEAAGLCGLGGNGLVRGLAAYREHAKALSVRALAAAFPRVQAWLGPEDFAGLAWAFARRHPPQAGDLARWGAGLPAFLAELPAIEPELPALAALDWGLHALSWQADEQPQADLLERLQAAGDGVLTLSAHLLRLHLPGGAWACAHAVGAPAWQLPDAGVGQGVLLVWRQGWQPCWAPLPPGWGLWLERLQTGASLGAAIEATLEAVPDFDPGQALHTALAAGWLLELQA